MLINTFRFFMIITLSSSFFCCSSWAESASEWADSPPEMNETINQAQHKMDSASSNQVLSSKAKTTFQAEQNRQKILPTDPKLSSVELDYLSLCNEQLSSQLSKNLNFKLISTSNVTSSKENQQTVLYYQAIILSQNDDLQKRYGKVTCKLMRNKQVQVSYQFSG